VIIGVNLSPQQLLQQQQNSTVIGNSSSSTNSSSSNVVMGPQLPFTNNWNNSSYNNSSSNNNSYQLVQLQKFELKVHPLETVGSIKERYNYY
jgi:hypothetical protein